MLASEVTARVRQLLADPNTSGRYTEAELLGLVSDAQRLLTRVCKWPKGVLLGTTIANQMEYTLPEVERVDYVYIAGQPILPTTVEALQGNQIGFYDETATGYTPQWISAPAEAYPVASNMGGYNAMALPFYPGDRPQYYRRGGNIGFVPPPGGAYPIMVYCIPVPAAVTNDAQLLVFPSQAKEALAWRVVADEMFADGNESMMEKAEAKYQENLKILLGSLKGIDHERPSGPMVRTYRNQYRGLLGRSSRGWWT